MVSDFYGLLVLNYENLVSADDQNKTLLNVF